MKQISKFSLMRLNNSEHHQFHTIVIGLVNANTEMNQLPVMTDYSYNVLDQTTAMSRTRGSDKTLEIQNSIQQRGEIESSLRLKVKSAALDPDETIRNAGKRVLFVMNKYGNMRTFPYQEQSTLIAVRHDELESTYQDDIAKIGLSNLLVSLIESNIVITDYFKERGAEKIKAKTLNVMDNRKHIDANYNSLVLLINAKAVISGKNTYDDLIDKLNYNIEYFRQQVDNRLARIAAEKKEPPTPKPV